MNATATMTRLDSKPAAWDEKHPYEHPHYRVTVKTEKGRASFDFWGSYNDYQTGEESEPADALACFASDAMAGMESFEEFCSGFGYDTDSRKARKIWKSCKNAATKAERLGLSWDDLARLSDN